MEESFFHFSTLPKEGGKKNSITPTESTHGNFFAQGVFGERREHHWGDCASQDTVTEYLPSEDEGGWSVTSVRLSYCSPENVAVKEGQVIREDDRRAGQKGAEDKVRQERRGEQRGGEERGGEERRGEERGGESGEKVRGEKSVKTNQDKRYRKLNRARRVSSRKKSKTKKTRENQLLHYSLHEPNTLPQQLVQCTIPLSVALPAVSFLETFITLGPENLFHSPNNKPCLQLIQSISNFLNSL